MNPFHDRTKELQDLLQIVFYEEFRESLTSDEYRRNSLVKTICLFGEEGIGKTSLAHAFLNRTGDQPYVNYFERKISVTAYMGDWDMVLATLARDLGLDPSNQKMIESSVLAKAKDRRLLILLDNINDIETNTIKRFVQRWMDSDHNSILLLTNGISLFNDPSPDQYYPYEVKGIQEDFVISNLLGHDLNSIIQRGGLQSDLKKLGGNPQKLLFLRWRNLGTIEELKGCMDELEPSLGETCGRESPVGTVLAQCNYPLTHFLALGRIREAEFSGTLLAFLWDRLGGGSTELYEQILGWLSEKQLVVVVQQGDELKLRLSASVHIRLQALLEREVGKKRLHYIDYFIAEYFRNLFSRRRVIAFEPQLLGHYVHHALDSGNFDSVYSYMFKGEIADAAHYLGLSLEMKNILQELDRQWPTLNDSGKKTGKVVEQAVRIKIDLAYVYNDLTEHKSCLVLLNQADAILDSEDGKKIHEETVRSLKRKIWHCAGISYSQTGRIDECTESYSKLVLDSARQKEVTWFDALTLGYIAYEIKFTDMARAVKFGSEALELSRQIGDENTVLKNLCSFGQILLYNLQVERAQEMLQEADVLLRRLNKIKSVDKREIGRVLINSAALYIHKGEFDEAQKRLKEGARITRETGDQRRAAMANAYLAITCYHCGDENNAKQNLLKAVEEHREIDSIRETLYETLTYLWILDKEFSGDLKSINLENLPDEISRSVEFIRRDPRSGPFLEYWQTRYTKVMLRWSD